MAATKGGAYTNSATGALSLLGGWILNHKWPDLTQTRPAPKAKWIGTVEAADADAAIEAAAKQFATDASKLIAVRRR